MRLVLTTAVVVLLFAVAAPRLSADPPSGQDVLDGLMEDYKSLGDHPDAERLTAVVDATLAYLKDYPDEPEMNTLKASAMMLFLVSRHMQPAEQDGVAERMLGLVKDPSPLVPALLRMRINAMVLQGRIDEARDLMGVLREHPMGGSTADQCEALFKWHDAVDAPADSREAAPAFSLRRADGTGDAVTLESLRGKWVLVDFWATWCGPCKMAMDEHLKPLHAKGDDRLVIVSIGVNRRDNAAAQVKLAKEKGYNWTMLFDADGTASKAYGVSGIPHIALIDPQGRIVLVGAGTGVAPFIEKILARELKPAAAQQADPQRPLRTEDF